MRSLIVSMIMMSMVFSFNVSYKFVSSKLVVEIDGKWEEYNVIIDSTTMRVGSRFSYPWSRGKVGTMIVNPVGSKEERKIFIDATHDDPPSITIDMPRILGYGLYEFGIELVDDWDTPEGISVLQTLDSIPINSGTLVKIDTFFLDEGEHTLEISAVDSYGNRSDEEIRFRVDVTPPDPPKYEFGNPDLVKFTEKPNLILFDNDDSIKVLRKVDFIKRDKPLIIRKIDDVGNESRLVVIPPIPGTLSLPSAKGPIASIRESLLIMGPQSYTVIGKVLIPEGKSLVLGENSSLVISPTGELLVKGTLMNVSKSARITGGTIRVSENGEVFLDSMDFESKMVIEGGKTVYIKGMKFKDLEVSNVDFLILENVEMNSLKLDHCYVVSIHDSTISRLNAVSLRDLEIWSSSLEITEVSNFSRTMARGSNIGSLIIDTFSRIDCFKCELDSLTASLGSLARMRSSKIERVSIKDFSTLDLFRSHVLKVKEGANSEVRSEKSEVESVE